MSVYERVAEKTEAMSSAVYAALDAIDAYGEEMRLLLDEQEASGDPNPMLVSRLGQFATRSDTMARLIEDEVVTEMLFCLDRLFSVKTAEEGTFI